ncbi:TIR domain-containing protein [Brevibacillus centrosporus]|uniref:TIR domain-containing protein n=1 Tax=Brevibacillus centrosporus TaxID=54910 RepID=UPI003B013DDC
MKPKIFIGSSIEGLDVAYAIQENLEYIAEVTVWDQGVFDLSSTAMHDLIDEINHSDFAIFVFHPDDYANIRSHETMVVRDNVIFESGLFIGRLGMERVFLVKPRGKTGDLPLRIATDLAGITIGSYQDDRMDGRLKAALGPFCNQVRKKVQELGPIASVDLYQKFKKLESFSRFMYYLVRYSKHTKHSYSQILSAFLAELETTPLFSKKGTTLFRLDNEKACFSQIGSSGVVNSEPLSFTLDHNKSNPDEPSFVVHAFENGWGLFQKGKRLGETEYLYTRRIADNFVISIHFLTDQTLAEDEVEQFDAVIYNLNKDIFDSFHVFLKGEVIDGE